MSDTTCSFKVESLAEIQTAAKRILDVSDGRKLFVFIGEMGAGKTTIIKEICRLLKVDDSLSSPSYSLVNEYRTTDNEPVYHIDLYRLNQLDDALAIGIEDYIDEQHYCFVEWPELIEPLLPQSAVRVYVAASDNVREINIFMS